MSTIRKAAATIHGALEFRSGFGRTYGDERDEAYDFGRELAHRITLRRWDAAARDWCYECNKTTLWRGETCDGCGREWGYPL